MKDYNRPKKKHNVPSERFIKGCVGWVCLYRVEVCKTFRSIYRNIKFQFVCLSQSSFNSESTNNWHQSLRFQSIQGRQKIGGDCSKIEKENRLVVIVQSILVGVAAVRKERQKTEKSFGVAAVLVLFANPLVLLLFGKRRQKEQIILVCSSKKSKAESRLGNRAVR